MMRLFGVLAPAVVLQARTPARAEEPPPPTKGEQSRDAR